MSLKKWEFGQKKYSLKSPEQKAAHAAYMRDYYRRHPDKAKEQRAKHREKRNANRRAWGKAKREHIRAYNQLPHVQAIFKTAQRKYRMANLDKKREWEGRRNARKRGSLSGPVDYADILARSADTCGICGDLVLKADREFDHIVPLALGGPHTTTNIQLAHARCNRSKGARLPLAA